MKCVWPSWSSILLLVAVLVVSRPGLLGFPGSPVLPPRFLVVLTPHFDVLLVDVIHLHSVLLGGTSILGPAQETRKRCAKCAQVAAMLEVYGGASTCISLGLAGAGSQVNLSVATKQFHVLQMQRKYEATPKDVLPTHCPCQILQTG